MPEGHTVHRLAAALEQAFGGRRVRTSSPQGRFPEAEQLDGSVLLGAEAVGKHLFLALAPAADVPADSPAVRQVHVHLGLYGSWTFAGEPGFADAHAIGAPRLRMGEREEAHGDGGLDWRRLVPRPTVRLRIAGEHGLADLTGPTACEVLDAQGRQAVLDRLGPDPLREDPDGRARRRFVDAVRRSRTTIGALLMNQQVVAGIGNIYRAELLFRARLDPFVPGRELSAGMCEEMWEDLVALMTYGARTGRIVTTQPAHRDIEARIVERSRGTRQNGDEDPSAVPREKSFYVYHRQTLPCRLCGTTVRSADLAGRTVFWCPRCQRVRRRRAGWTREHPATPWALADPAAQVA
ncbi:Fpg/Nei family DNA glycosylase [Brachybacterium saurashtrense]|uniref:DNA-(apurinic or apyrimidinic site) lyase n=1 Tax=Brachybacterium saurashtrense TaxID=556288 RepID=A0A345YLB2_9MICO|nr:DNA-formamidopyrimidine glycosylase family protein [Brachybacterium saurashtrense]AXK44714.1 Fpg/Nei family DNA glycosylase [Brachybacterium saurashtrense]RRR23326.1 Fpg/Nei family DNA glycosylase [Brachybacterium saurashtrense]